MNRRDRRVRLNDIAATAAESLRAEPIDAPDFTKSILDRVDAQRSFLAPSVRRRIHVGRWALGGCAVAVVLAAALTYRWSPAVATIAGGPAPISAVVHTLELNADKNLGAIAQSVRKVSIPEPTQILAAVSATQSVLDIDVPEPQPTKPALAASGGGSQVFIGPLLPLSTAMVMEPSHVRPVAFAEIQARWRIRPETSDLNAIMVRERTRARTILDNLSSGASPALLDHESDGLPVIR